jgi:hypothetical protein
MVRDQASTAPVTAGYLLPGPRRSVGELHRLHGRTVAVDADQQRDDAGTGLSATLALTTRYRGQSLVAALGASGAVGLLIAYIAHAGPWS